MRINVLSQIGEGVSSYTIRNGARLQRDKLHTAFNTYLFFKKFYQKRQIVGLQTRHSFIIKVFSHKCPLKRRLSQKRPFVRQ